MIHKFAKGINKAPQFTKVSCLNSKSIGSNLKYSFGAGNSNVLLNQVFNELGDPRIVWSHSTRERMIKNIGKFWKRDELEKMKLNNPIKSVHENLKFS